MDTTKLVECPSCGTVMGGHGGSFGGRIMSWNKKCPDCGLVLCIIPMKNEYRYNITAESDEEIDERLKKESQLHKLEREIDDLRRQLR